MATMSVSGVISGMDWDSMIDEIITNAAKPAQVKVNKKTNLTNKKSLFEEMKVTMNSLQSSLSPLKLPSTYKAKQIDIERIDSSGSHKGVLTATVNADAEVNVWDLKVNKLATAQVSRSKQVTSSTLSSTLNGLTSSTMYINMGGQKVGIEVNSTDSLQTLKSRINNTLKTLDNPLAITASVVDNKLILKSDNTGLGTRTATETINYNMSGVNRLSNISVPSSNAKNLKISSKGKSYTYGTDFTVANGNEIRWKQYDRSTEVALNDTVSVKYRMAANDVYSKTGTYGTGEAEISGFTMTDNGTLSKRVKITDSDGNTYTYGKDFTITDNKVVWLDDDSVKTNEPGTYTVSYSKTTAESYSVSGVKESATSEPASYAVQYSEELITPTNLTYGRHDAGYSFIKITAGSLSNFSDLTALDGVSSVTGTSGYTYLTFDDDSEPNITINGTEYVYGRDYVIRKGASSDEMFLVPYTAYTSEIDNYLAAAGKTIPDGVQNSPQSDIIAGSSGTLSYSHTTTIPSTNQSAISSLLSDSGTDTSNVVILKSDGTEYEAGTDYEISGGGIIWKLPNDTTDLTMSQFAELQAQYAQAYESEHGTSTSISTVTLVDGKGVLRTYVDPDDPSILTMSAGGQDYEYGRDYVLRVNDLGTGYKFQWLVDGGESITDADTVVATYAAYKNISTSSWQAAPAENTDYEFGFNYELTAKASATVSKTDTDKSLATVLGASIPASDYSSVTISGYTQGKDYVINSEGVIRWLNQNSDTPDAYKAVYTFSGSASTDMAVPDINSNGVASISGYGLSIDDTGAATTTYNGYTYIDEAEGKAAFTLTDSSGNTYEYGKDYAVRYIEGSTGAKRFTVVTPDNSDWPSDFSNQTGATSMTRTGLTLTYNNNVSRFVDSTETLAAGLGFTPSDWDKLTLTDADGNAYTKGTDYTVDETSGTITWSTSSGAPSHPTGEYTLTYEAFDALTAETAYDDSSTTQEASITVDSGYGKYGDTSLSYEQILSDLSLTSSSTSDTVAEKFAEKFTLTDEDGNEYTYGTDYTIIQGSDEDSTSGQHNVLINWISGGNTPSSGAAITLTYTGRGEGGGETLTTDGVKRSASDTINPDTSSITRASYSTFAAASEIRITNGDKEYFLNKDFTVSESTDGLSTPVINWNSGSEWFDQDTTSADSYTVYVTSGYSTSTYTATRAAGSTELSLAASVSYPKASDFASGTTTITQGTKTFYENEDFLIQDDGNGNAQVYWLNDRSGGTEWYYPNPGTSYTISHTDSSGSTKTYTASRNSSSTLSMADYGMTTANGSLTVQYGGVGLPLDTEPDYDDDGNAIPNTDGHAAIRGTLSIDITDRGSGDFTFNWVTPTLKSRSGLPSTGDELTVEYEYDANTFEITGEAADLLGLNDDVTEAQDAELVLDGETVYRASNDIGADYDNELIKGVTMHLKGTGEVSLDISHDAEKAVESIQTFVDTYNDLMSWMNTRMTESQLDEDTKATVDSDDFRMRWGLLHGNSLLRQTKSQMRSLTSQNFTFSFTQRKSSEEIYGTMSHNGLRSSSTLRLRIGTKFVDVTIDPTDTLQTIVDKINDDTKGGPMNDIYYDDDGNKLQSPLLRASVENDMLVINSTSSDEITMSGSAAMNVLKMNYTYKGLYQIGIETTSDDYGKSGELEFDTEEFMTALEDNPDEVQAMMLKFVTQFDTWTRSMLNSSATGETSGTLTREIENIQTQIDSINEYLETYQERLDRMEEQLRTKYGNTETQLSRLTQQANSIAAILNQLNGTAQGGGYGQTSS